MLYLLSNVLLLDFRSECCSEGWERISSPTWVSGHQNPWRRLMSLHFGLHCGTTPGENSYHSLCRKLDDVCGRTLCVCVTFFLCVFFFLEAGIGRKCAPKGDGRTRAKGQTKAAKDTVVFSLQYPRFPRCVQVATQKDKPKPPRILWYFRSSIQGSRGVSKSRAFHHRSSLNLVALLRKKIMRVLWPFFPAYLLMIHEGDWLS